MLHPARVALAATALLLAAPLAAQEAAPTTPPARPEDVASIPAIMKATYDVISGPAGPRDWDRFRSLFAPGARLIPTACPQGQGCRPLVWTPEEYIQRAGQYFNSTPFYEIETNSIVEQYGHVAHVFSTYAYQIGMVAGELSNGAAISLFMFPFMLIFTIAVLWYQRRDHA